MADDDLFVCPYCGFVVHGGFCGRCKGKGDSKYAQKVQAKMNRAEIKRNGKGYMPPDYVDDG